MENKLSPAAQFVSIVCDFSGHRKRGAESQFDGCQQDALFLAIRAHLPFEIDDMEWIRRNCRFTWHAGNGDNWGEMYYSASCAIGNGSAARSFEKMKGRKLFIWKWEVNHHGAGRGTSGRVNDRLSVGDTFRCRGKLLTVTSFDDKNAKIICCTYKPQERDGRGYTIGTLKVERVYKLNIKELRALADPSVGAPDLDNVKKVVSKATNPASSNRVLSK